MSENEVPEPDYGVVRPVSLPPDGRIPDPATGSSTPAEYDRYFRILRDDPSLLRWSRSCLEVQERLLDDLNASGLTPDERCEVLRGCVLILQTTLEKWVKVGDRVDGEEPR